MFPLCFTCCKHLNKHVCNHSALTGTWISDELKKAVQKGYKIIEVYEVWNYTKFSVYDPVTKTGGLFTRYIDTFLKIKQEASSWPEWVKSEADADKFIDSYFEKEGIKLNPDDIIFNQGLRSLAKLILNNLWGKLSQRSNLPKTTYVTENAEFFEILSDEKRVIKSVNFPSSEMAEIQWISDDGFTDESFRTNVTLAAYTTAHARLKLYSLLEILGERCLYCDTDSVFYVLGENDTPLPLGDFLGELTDEIESDNHICEFISGGPKNYSYKLVKPNSQGQQYFCKVKGVTLNFRGAQIINFDSIKEMILNDGIRSASYFVEDPYKILRDRERAEIVTKSVTKRYSFRYDKRVIRDDYVTYPYGY